MDSFSNLSSETLSQKESPFRIWNYIGWMLEVIWCLFVWHLFTTASNPSSNGNSNKNDPDITLSNSNSESSSRLNAIQSLEIEMKRQNETRGFSLSSEKQKTMKKKNKDSTISKNMIIAPTKDIS